MSVYEDSLLEENLNQNDDVETNDIDYKLREISALLSGKLDILLLVSQHQKHEAHSKMKKIRLLKSIQL
ncbi:unnamed protein product [Rhizophagus irregularis]|nr:unnamed protein product [Rhizophagus irregularis]